MSQDKINFVTVDGSHIPFVMHKPTNSEIVIHFYIPTQDMQFRHNWRFHSNHMHCDWYQQKYLLSIGVSFKFHQAGYAMAAKNWNNINHPIFKTGVFDDKREVFELTGYNRVELFGDNIPETVAALFLKAYLQKADNPFA